MEHILRDDPTWYLPSIWEARGPTTLGLENFLNPPKSARTGGPSTGWERLTQAELLERDEATWAAVVPRMIKPQKNLVPGQVHKPTQDKSHEYSEAPSGSDDESYHTIRYDDDSGHSTPSDGSSDAD